MAEYRPDPVTLLEGELGNKDPTKYWQLLWRAGPPYPMHWCGAACLWALRMAGLCDWDWKPWDGKEGGFLHRLPRTELPEAGDIAYRDEPYQHHAMVRSTEAVTLAEGQLAPRIIVHTVDGNSGWLRTVALKNHALDDPEWSYFSIRGLIDPEARP